MLGDHKRKLLQFLNFEGNATLVTSEYKAREVREFAFLNNIGIRNLIGKKVKSIYITDIPTTEIIFE